MPVQLQFDWDPRKEAANRAKHGVTFQEAMGVFADPLAASILDAAAPPDEERWITLGLAAPGLLVVVHTAVEITEDLTYIRIISARRATKRERKSYENDPT